MSYWEVHGVLFLAGLLFFPRLTVILFSAVTGGFFFWAGFIFFPRIFIAVLACITYWQTNPVLCVIACLLCLAGESCEKAAAKSTL